MEDFEYIAQVYYVEYGITVPSPICKKRLCISDMIAVGCVGSMIYMD